MGATEARSPWAQARAAVLLATDLPAQGRRPCKRPPGPWGVSNLSSPPGLACAEGRLVLRASPTPLRAEVWQFPPTGGDFGVLNGASLSIAPSGGQGWTRGAWQSPSAQGLNEWTVPGMGPSPPHPGWATAGNVAILSKNPWNPSTLEGWAVPVSAPSQGPETEPPSAPGPGCSTEPITTP